MNPEDFSRTFERLTGSKPFPWQEALFQLFITTGAPTSANIPTGLGKTAVVAVWLCALACRPERVSRRLVYVVNRRTVVDQTTTEVTKWREALQAAELRERLAALSAVPLGPDDSPLALSTLRGQFADNREWSADPARPAVIVGTVDMIGSRLLFSGYACGFKTRPHHAAFLGQDVLLIHDEAHLEPAFQTLLSSIVAQQARDGDARPLRVLQLSATTRTESAAFELTAKDERTAEITRRLHATKKLRLHPIADEKSLAEKLVELALSKRDSGRAILIFARSVEDVQRVNTALQKQKLKQEPMILTGTMRGLERDALVREPVFQRFLPPSHRSTSLDHLPSGTVYLVATSAGEVGVNLSADDLVCDLSTFESMAQRFGRVNRFGERGDSEIALAHPEKFNLEDRLDAARARTLALLQQLGGNASPAALRGLPAGARAEAFSPEPAIRPATDILFDAWSLTTIRHPLPGRPPVAPYLHGIADWQPPETYVAWRQEVHLITGPLRDTYDPAELLADYPLKPHELLRDRSSRVHKHLMKLAERAGNQPVPVWLVNDDGSVEVATLAEFSEKNAEARLHDRTLLLPPLAGGLVGNGTLDGSAPAMLDGAEDVADRWLTPDSQPLRQRVRDDEPKPYLQPGSRLRLIRTIDLHRFVDEEELDTPEGAPATGRYWHWLEAARASDRDSIHQAGHSVLLDVHSSDVACHASAIAHKIGLPRRLQHVVTLAARFHDLGKRRHSWQRGIGNLDHALILAKAGRELRPRDVGDRYRHEFGSLHDVVSLPEYESLNEEERDLLLHLIAAHHGRARPHFPSEEATDPEHALVITQATAEEVPRRFARLQRRHGRWGLAYLESILRAADHAASANPSATREASS